MSVIRFINDKYNNIITIINYSNKLYNFRTGLTFDMSIVFM